MVHEATFLFLIVTVVVGFQNIPLCRKQCKIEKLPFLLRVLVRNAQVVKKLTSDSGILNQR